MTSQWKNELYPPTHPVRWRHMTHVQVWTFTCVFRILPSGWNIHENSDSLQNSIHHLKHEKYHHKHNINVDFAWFRHSWCGVSSFVVPLSSCLPQAQGCCWTSQGYHPVVQSHQLPNLRIRERIPTLYPPKPHGLPAIFAKYWLTESQNSIKVSVQLQALQNWDRILNTSLPCSIQRYFSRAKVMWADLSEEQKTWHTHWSWLQNKAEKFLKRSMPYKFPTRVTNHAPRSLL